MTDRALTWHENAILNMLANGHNHKTAAWHLRIPVAQAHHHTRNARRKLNARTTTHAVATLIRHRRP